MTVYGLAAHTLRVRPQRGGEDSYRQLDNFDSAGSDLLVRIYGFLKSCEGADVVENNQHFQVQRVEPRGRRIFFTTEIGTSGRTGTLRHRHTGAITKKEPPHVDGLILRCWVIIPKDQRVGLVFAEQAGRRGIARPFLRHLKAAFRAAHSGWMLDDNAVTSQEAWGQLLQRTDTDRIVLRSSELSDELAAAMGIGKEVASVTVEIKPKRRRLTGQSLWNAVSDDTKRSGLLEVVGLGTDSIDVGVPVRGSKRSRTIRLTHDVMPSTIFPVGGERESVPPFSDIRKALEDLAPVVGEAVNCPPPDNWDMGDWEQSATQARMRRVTGDDLTNSNSNPGTP